MEQKERENREVTKEKRVPEFRKLEEKRDVTFAHAKLHVVVNRDILMIHLSNSGKMIAKFNCIVYMNDNHMMNNAASPL